MAPEGDPDTSAVLQALAAELELTLRVPAVASGRLPAPIVYVSDSAGLCPLCVAERAVGRGKWDCPVGELAPGGSAIRLRDFYYTCTNKGCPGQQALDGLEPADWIARLGGSWERWREGVMKVVVPGNVVPIRVVDTNSASVLASVPERQRPTTFSPDLIRNPVRDAFVLGQMIPFGKPTVLYGPSSAGKTTLESQIALAFALGWEDLWGLPLAPGGGPVLIYTLEDTYNDWHLKVGAFCRASGVTPEDASLRLRILAKESGFARFTKQVSVRIRLSTGEEITTSEHRASDEQDHLIEDACAIGAKLILVETASRLVEKEDNESFSALQSALGRIAQATGAALIASHHATKEAIKDNDPSQLGARGGSSLVFNSRNALALFPAENGAGKMFPALPKEGLFTLTHTKATSSTRRGAPLTLFLADPGGDLGGQFQLPEEVVVTPEMADRAARQRAGDAARGNQKLRALYREAKRIREVEGKPITKKKLQSRAAEIGVKRSEIERLIAEACSLNYLSASPEKCRGGGQEYFLGFDPDIGDGSAPILE